MTIEQNLERIANSMEKLVEIGMVLLEGFMSEEVSKAQDAAVINTNAVEEQIKKQEVKKATKKKATKKKVEKEKIEDVEITDNENPEEIEQEYTAEAIRELAKLVAKKFAKSGDGTAKIFKILKKHGSANHKIHELDPKVYGKVCADLQLLLDKKEA
jgi:hypothetical protein